VLADASLEQAKRALSAVHVAVLLLDAPRLLTVGQVRFAGTQGFCWQVELQGRKGFVWPGRIAGTLGLLAG
jgi:hypothetical protein